MRTELTPKDLRRMAVQLIREDSKAASIRARCLGWRLAITDDDRVILIADGVRTNDPFRPGTHGYRFNVQSVL